MKILEELIKSSEVPDSQIGRPGIKWPNLYQDLDIGDGYRFLVETPEKANSIRASARGCLIRKNIKIRSRYISKDGNHYIYIIKKGLIDAR
jgi:hypothetical protein